MSETRTNVPQLLCRRYDVETDSWVRKGGKNLIPNMEMAVAQGSGDRVWLLDIWHLLTNQYI